MIWVLVPLGAFAMSAFIFWTIYKGGRSVDDAEILDRLERQDAALKAAQRRISNLEAIVADGLDERLGGRAGVTGDEPIGERFGPPRVRQAVKR